jgi:hypothetical protein
MILAAVAETTPEVPLLDTGPEVPPPETVPVPSPDPSPTPQPPPGAPQPGPMSEEWTMPVDPLLVLPSDVGELPPPIRPPAHGRAARI